MTFLEYVHSKGFNYASLAKATGISKRTIEKYGSERQLKYARAWFIVAVADALGVTPKELLEETEDVDK